jgi:oligoendopeptidase F
MIELKKYERRYVEAAFKVDQWKSVEPYLEDLKSRVIPEADNLKKWLADLGELISVVFEESTSREVEMTCHTEDEAIKARYLDFIENIDPPFKEAIFALYQKFLASPVHKMLGADFEQLISMIQTEVELFDEKNIQLELTEAKLCQNYQEVTGSWMVSYEGREYTLPEMAVFLESNDAAVRKSAFTEMVSCRIKDKNCLNELYSELLQVRQKIAANVGLPSYREYLFKQNRREYTPQDCLAFHDSVLEKIVPLVSQLREKKAHQMGQDFLYPWDNACDPMNYPPLRPFGQVNHLQDGVEKIFGLIDPRLRDYFALIRSRQDLDSRKGKAPGGYQATFDEQRMPFIFMNAAGLQEDVETLLHEAGHSFHSLQYRDQNLFWYRGAPMEFCEVSSMSFELIGGEHFDVFYSHGSDALRARLKHLTGVLELFPWVMIVDSFQHWVYTHPEHSIEERANYWMELHQKFDPSLNWNTLSEEVQKNWWHKQLHIFLDPFYYIEYAISQLGALQIYRNYKKNPTQTLNDFLAAMSLGGSKSCKEIFSRAGIEFRFDPALVGELADMVYQEILALEKACHH